MRSRGPFAAFSEEKNHATLEPNRIDAMRAGQRCAVPAWTWDITFFKPSRFPAPFVLSPSFLKTPELKRDHRAICVGLGKIWLYLHGPLGTNACLIRPAQFE
jgi:hypothetical protein